MEFDSKTAGLVPGLAGGVAASPPAPRPIADERPSADALALARDPRPDVPLPVPPVPSQMGLIGQALTGPVATDPAGIVRPLPDGTLKPYGVTLLPARSPQEEAARLSKRG